MWNVGKLVEAGRLWICYTRTIVGSNPIVPNKGYGVLENKS